MPYKNPYILIFGGFFLTLLLWFATLPALGHFQLQFPSKPEESVLVSMPYFRGSTSESAQFTIKMALNVLPFQSPIIRIIPDDCLDSLRIDGANVTPGLLALPLCYPDVLTFDASPFLSAGSHEIMAGFTDNGGDYGADIKPVHSTLAMCLIALSFAVFFYGLRLKYKESLASGRTSYRQWLLMAVLLSIAVLGRMKLFGFISSDFYFQLSHWWQHIQRFGLLHAYGQNFANYAPLYTYLIGISDFFFPDNGLYTIKFLTFAGDIAAAMWVYHIVKKHGTKGAIAPAIAACLLLASPSGIVNGAAAAQCDIFYSFFLMLTMYYLYMNRPLAALVYYGISISFKMQAIFLSPLLLVFLLRRVIPWYLVWVPAAVYVLTILPCWFEGRDLWDLLTIYLGQFNTYSIFGDSIYSAGNFYFLLRGPFENNQDVVIHAGLLATVAGALLFACTTYKRWKDDKTFIDYVLLSTFCVSLMPFLLPRMLDRYFFPAELFALLLACLKPRWWIFTVLFQTATLLVYFPSNFNGLPIDWSFNTRHTVALILNLAAIAGLGVLCWRHIWHPHVFKKKSTI